MDGFRAILVFILLVESFGHFMIEAKKVHPNWTMALFFIVIQATIISIVLILDLIDDSWRRTRKEDDH